MGFYGFEKIKESVYIFIEFCPNGTLTDLIKEGIEEAETLRLFRQLVEGMCYMNAKGISFFRKEKCIEISSQTTF